MGGKTLTAFAATDIPVEMGQLNYQAEWKRNDNRTTALGDNPIDPMD
jgi:hypothetical protein